MLVGGPYGGEVLAREAGTAWDSRLRRAFAAVGVTAKFERTPFSLSDATLEAASLGLGSPVLPDDDGVIIYASEPPPHFMRFDATGTLRPSAEALLTALRTTPAGEQLNPSEQLAYRLWAASDFVATIAEARFTLLMIALECLAQPVERRGGARQHVKRLMDLTTAAADLPDDERDSILGALSALRSESTRRACLRLADRVDGRRYAEADAKAFIKTCYDRRNALVHGRADHPTTQEADLLAANLSRLVSDLLAGPGLLATVDAARSPASGAREDWD